MRFTKMQGVGNDFVLLSTDALAPETDLAALALHACGRRFGVGADGLLVVGRGTGGFAPPTNDNASSFFMRMFNPDGTEDMCGNGLRCAGLWAYRAGWTEGRRFAVATREGSRMAELLSTDTNGGQLRVEMGVPRFAPAEIPFAGLDSAINSQGPLVDLSLPVGEKTFQVTTLNTGSTHTVLFGPPPDEDTFERISPRIELHPWFPERTSVLWATQTSPHAFSVRIWERGAGETWGCGTGACAVGVAAQLRGQVDTDLVDVVSRGGTLRIAWPGADQQIQMTGPAQFVFEGDLPFGAAS